MSNKITNQPKIVVYVFSHQGIKHLNEHYINTEFIKISSLKYFELSEKIYYAYSS